MDLVELTPGHADHLAAYVELSNVINQADSPWQPRVTLHRQEMFLRYGWECEPPRAYLACDGGRPVGVAALHTSDHDNLDLAWLEVRVLPAERRRGHGTAILAGLCDVARTMGRPLVGIDGLDSAATIGFAESAGFARKSAEIRRLLEPATAPDPREVRDEVAPMAADYDLVRLEGYSPTALLPELAELTAAINDAPLDDLEWEDEVFTPERVRAYERAQIESGFRFRRVLARHRPTGELAGHTVLVVDAEQPELADQHDTSVARAHRGHRLGLLLKSEMLVWLAEDEPQVTRILTDNAESNAYMIAVNERLGFRPVGRYLEFQQRLH